MKLIITVLLTSLFATGCTSAPVKIVEREPYAVYITVPTSPSPPTVGLCDYQVDKLTDGADSGTVAQAYKHDTTCLREKVRLYEQALEQYKKLSENAAKVETELKQQFEQVLEKYKRDIEEARKAGEPQKP